MIFDKEHKVILESLKPQEARAFVKFLESEILRHRQDIIDTQDRINQVILKFGYTRGYKDGKSKQVTELKERIQILEAVH